MAERIDNTIETQISDGNTLVTQVNENRQLLQTVVQDVPQVQTVLQDGINVSSQINAPFIEVTSVNGRTGDVITEPTLEDFNPNTYYRKNTLVSYGGSLYFANDNFTSGSAFDADDWTEVSSQGITSWDDIPDKPNFATVATSGSYNDLSNKPNLATVATSGSYTDLTNKPTIPTVNNATLTIQKNGSNVQTFTANQGTNATANISVPTKTSDLTNDSGFLDSVAWPVYTARLSSSPNSGTANYDFTPDTPLENNKVYAVKFPTPTVNNATIILGDGVTSGSILVPPVSATDSPNYELLTTDMINNTEPLLLMYNGVQWVCLNQKKRVANGDIDWDTFKPYWKVVSTSTSSSVTIPAGYHFYRIRMVGTKTSANAWGVVLCSQATGTTWIHIQGMSNGTWVTMNERSVNASSDKTIMDGSRSATATGFQTWDIAISKPDKNGTVCLATWETGMSGSLTFNTGRSIFSVANGTADMNLYCELSTVFWSVEALVEN